MNATLTKIKPNLIQVDLDSLTLWFSYCVLIGASRCRCTIFRRNEWSRSTGRHLSLIGSTDRKARLDGPAFAAALQALLRTPLGIDPSTLTDNIITPCPEPAPTPTLPPESEAL
jgi:hypothetical protein